MSKITYPECGKILYYKKGKNQLVCIEKDCGFKKEISPENYEN